jgi:hypothetical protein
MNEIKKENGRAVRHTTFHVGKQSYIYGYEGSQALSACPSAKGKLKTWIAV